MTTSNDISCLNKCGRIRRLRGMCRSCYDKLWNEVRTGLTTWEKAEAAHRCLPAGRRVPFLGFSKGHKK